LLSPPRCLCLGCRPAPAYHRSRRPGWQARPYGFQVPVQYGGVQEDAPREACFMVWAIWPAISRALSYARRSTIRKEWWFSSRMVLSCRDVKALLTSSSTMSSRSSRLRMPEVDAPFLQGEGATGEWPLPFGSISARPESEADCSPGSKADRSRGSEADRSCQNAE